MNGDVSYPRWGSGQGVWPWFPDAAHLSAMSWPDSPWGNTTYPTGSGTTRMQIGWTCSGCGACWNPRMLRCEDCGPKAGSEPDDCQPAREGGMCSCEEGG